jgi:hypothetical protein
VLSILLLLHISFFVFFQPRQEPANRHVHPWG